MPFSLHERIFMQREAEASCALDGDTQSFPVSEWVKYVRFPNGKIAQQPYWPSSDDLLLGGPDNAGVSSVSRNGRKRRDDRCNSDANADLRDVPR